MLNIIEIICSIYFIVIIFCAFIGKKLSIFPIKVFRKKNKFNKDLDFEEEGIKLKQYKQIEYFREIPCYKNIFIGYWVCKAYRIINLNKLETNIIGAILLKWAKNENITIEERTKNSNDYIMKFNNKENINTKSESKLWEILQEASGTNKILEANELKAYYKNRKEIIRKWFDILDDEATDMLREKKLINRKTKKIMKGENSEEKIVIDSVDKKSKDEAEKIIGLKKFLSNYSIISERETNEIQIWEEYLSFAQLLGIADKIREQFKKIYINFDAIQYFTKIFNSFTMLDIIFNILYACYLPIIIPIYYYTRVKNYKT